MSNTGSIEVEGGGLCPKCGEPMQRFKHGVGWKPQEGRSFYRYWDRCIPCAHFQNYPDALEQMIGAMVARHEKTSIGIRPKPPRDLAVMLFQDETTAQLLRKIVVAIINKGHAADLYEFPDVLAYFGARSPSDEELAEAGVIRSRG